MAINFLTGQDIDGNLSVLGTLHVNKGGTAGVQTIVATLSSTSQRPVLQFSETSSSGITAGMSIEYHGVGTGDSNYMAINSVTGAAKVVIKSGGMVLFNAYDGTNNTGTPTYLLGTDVFGNIVKTLGSGIPGGPYLKNTTDTFTGDLSVAGNIFLQGGGENYGAISPISQGMKISVGDPANTNSPLVTFDGANQRVGIGTDSPKAKLDVNSVFCVDSKEHTITNAFTTCLTVNLTSHTGCHVVITAFGDWGGHSSAAYRGEFFLQNGANIYNEPGIILRQDDNTSDGTDQIICQIVDPASTANPKDFQIQIRHTDTTSPASFDAQLTYTVQGKFNSIT